MISPSVIISHRQIIFPYSGFSLINWIRSSLLKVFGFRTPFLVAMKFSFSLRSIFSFRISATISPIAGELVRPGDSIPAQSINPFASSSSPIRNSCPSSWARSPAKEVITWRIGMFFTFISAFVITSFKPSRVVFVPSLFSISIAVGPTNRFPWTVGVTRTPFPYFPGRANTVWLT